MQEAIHVQPAGIVREMADTPSRSLLFITPTTTRYDTSRICAGTTRRHGPERTLMGDTDFSTQFQAICQKATVAQEKIKNACRCQHMTEVAGTQGRASQAAGHQVRADTGQGAASARWQEIRDRWRRHVEKLPSDIQKTKADLNASDAMQNAGAAESYAREAIQFALDAIDGAENAALDAISARATANALIS